ncbi:MAG: BLUF domain-containing protein [Pseudomonadota bacterium]
MPKAFDIVQVVYKTRPILPSDDGTRVLDGLTSGDSDRLTGLNVAFGDNLVGIIEGPEPVVFDRMEQLTADHRVPGINVLREATVKKRRFSSWSSYAVCEGTQREEDVSLANLFAERLSRALYSHS